MDKKIGFIHWCLLLPIRLFKWLFGIAKDGLKGSIQERMVVGSIIYVFGSLFISTLIDHLTGNSLCYFSIWLIPAISLIPFIICWFGLALYLEYSEEVKQK